MEYGHGGDVFEKEILQDFSININPLGMREEVAEAICLAVTDSDIYPDYKYRKLAELIAGKHGVAIENVVCGNGASEIIHAIARCGFKSGVVVNPTFSEYEKSLAVAGVEVFAYDMAEHLEYRHDDVAKTQNADITFICNPNNPTGKYTDLGVIKALAEKTKASGGVLVVDECFMEFCENGESAISLLDEFDNLIILRAFTKSYAMAGVRLGYAVSSVAMVEKIKGQLPMWNVSYLAQRAGETAIEKCGDFSEMLEVVKSGRKYLESCLLHFGFKVYISDINFILFECGFDLKSALLKKGVLIRDCENFRGLSKFYYRICVKTQDHNRDLVRKIAEVLASEGRL